MVLWSSCATCKPTAIIFTWARLTSTTLQTHFRGKLATSPETQPTRTTTTLNFASATRLDCEFKLTRWVTDSTVSLAVITAFQESHATRTISGAAGETTWRPTSN